jgi:hypothetical protein
MGDAYRDDRDGLRARLLEAERAAAMAEERARDLEGQLAVATSTSPRLARLAGLIVFAFVAAGVGMVVGVALRGGQHAALTRRWQSVHSIDVGVERQRDVRRCRLRFARAEPRVDHGRSIAECHTRVICDETVYEGMTQCGDHEHLRDPGRLEVNLVTGEMILDGDRYRL